MAQRKQQETKAMPVRSLDGRTTTVRLAAACSVDDLKAALRASNFPPPAGASAFHLFLKGAKLLPQAKVGNLPIHAGDFVSLIPFTAKPTTPAPFGRHAFSSSPWAAAGTRRKLSSAWNGGDNNDMYAPNKMARPSSSSCSNHCGGTESLASFAGDVL